MPNPVTKKIEPMSYKYYPWAMAMTDCEDNVWISQKGAQLSISEVLINVAFHAMDKRRQSVLYVLPAQKPDATDFSLTRFNPALEHSPYLNKMFDGNDTLGLKMAGHLALYIRGSRGKAALKSVPVGTVILDEVDEMSDSAIALAEERMSGQMGQTYMRAASTPTIPDEGVNKLFKKSTQDFFTFECPHCSKQTHLVFPDCLVITADTPEDPKINDSYLVCKECKHELDQRNKFEWLANGKWVSTYPGRVTRGFHISQLYSSTISPGKIASKYLAGKYNQADEQEFYNSKLGEAHVVAGARIEAEEVKRAKAPYANGEILDGICTMGIDVGTDLHFVVCQYKFEPNVFDINMNSLAQVAFFGRVKAVTNDFLTLLAHVIRKYDPVHLCIDAGPERASSRLFCKQLPTRSHAVNYIDTVAGKAISDSDDYTISVNRTFWLDTSLGRFKSEKILIPSNVDNEFCNHICAMTKHYFKDRSGQVVARYLKGSGRTDYAHALNYAEIALHMANEAGHLGSIKL